MQAPRLLTVTQPWAWAIVAGIRPILTRFWTGGTVFTGPVLIHAARRQFDPDGKQWLLDHAHAVPDELSQGTIAGRVYLACCVSAETVRATLGSTLQAWIDPNPGAWHLVFTDPEMALHPVRAYDAPNHGLVPAPAGWKAAFAEKTRRGS